MSRIFPVTPPALPAPNETYSPIWLRNLNNILRLYFNRMVNAVNTVTGKAGGQYLDFPNGLFFSSEEQYLAAVDTPQAITYNNTYLNNYVDLAEGSTSRIRAGASGIYSFQLSAQLESGNNSAKTMVIWIRRDGQDIPFSARVFTLAGAVSLPLAWGFSIDLQQGQYVEIMSQTDDLDLHFHTGAASATHPAASAAIMTVHLISLLPDVLPTLPST